MKADEGAEVVEACRLGTRRAGEEERAAAGGRKGSELARKM